MRLAKGARVTKLVLNGNVITGRVRSSPGAATARVPVGGPLRYGRNVLRARFSAPGKVGFATTRFTLVRPGTGLVRIASPRPGARVAAGPLTVALGASPGTTLRAWLNGREITGRLVTGAGGLSRATLAPDAGLRFGTNEIRVRAVKASSGRIQSVSRQVNVPRSAPLASAGPDRRTAPGLAIRLDGRASRAVPGTTGALRHRWTVVSAPRGGTHRLTRAATARPVLSGMRPGRYVLRDTVSGSASSPVAASALRQDAVVSSSDTTQVTVAATGSPVAVNAATGGTPGIYLGGTLIPAGFSGPGVQMLVLDRATLEVQSASAAYPAGSMSQLLSAVQALASAGGQPLVVLSSLPGGAPANPDSDANALTVAAQLVAGPTAPAPLASTFALVGIPGAPQTPPSLLGSVAAPLDGYFTLDINGNFTFTFGDYVPFDTGAYSATAGNTITVGPTTYSVPPAAAGTGGFQVVYLDPVSLTGTCTYYATGGGATLSCTTGSVPGAVGGAVPVPSSGGGPGPACGPPPLIPCVNPTPSPSPAGQMNADLTNGAQAGQLVAVASVGSPIIKTGGGVAAAAGIAAMGGTEDLFSRLGPTSTYSLVGPTPAQKFPAEASSVITPGSTGEVTGVLARTPSGGGFAPLTADVSGQADFTGGLGAIAFQQPAAWPYSSTAGQQAALADISSRLGLGCDALGACNVRNTYGTLRGAVADYSTQLSNLKYLASSSFTAQDFSDVKNELLTEFPQVAIVWNFIGELQQPYVSGGAGELANLTNISSAVEDAVNPPPASTAVQQFLSFATDFMWAVSIIPGEGPVAEVAADAGVLAVAAAFGSDLSTTAAGAPQPTVQAAGDQLASQILDRADQMQQGIGNLGAIIVADAGKLSQVSSLAGGEWAMTSAQQNALEDAVEVGAAQTFYTALMPTAYAAWQTPGVTSAASWSCIIARNLTASPFQGIAATGQISLTVPAVPGLTTASSQVYALYLAGQNPGDANDADPKYQPPASLTDDLFATASPDTQAAGFYPPWFWERAYLVPGVKALPSTGGLCSG